MLIYLGNVFFFLHPNNLSSGDNIEFKYYLKIEIRGLRKLQNNES